MIDNLLNPVLNGFKVIASETKWVFVKGIRRWEIKQMEKRLAEEYQTLGKNCAATYAKGDDFDPKSSDNDLALKQIEFLREEIAHLEQDLAATRSEYIRNRMSGTGREAN